MPEKGKTLSPANRAQCELDVCKTIAAALETPAISPRLSGVQLTQSLEASSSWSRRASAAALQHRAQNAHAVGSLQLLRKDWIAMLQPPLTLPSRSPWDPCIARRAAAVREQHNHYVIACGLLICAASELTGPPSLARGTASGRGARGRAVTRGPKMPHFTRCEPSR